MKEKKQRINIKRQLDNNKKAGKITTEKQERNTTQKQVCLLTILASSLLCALFTLFHSHPPPRFPVPLVSTGIYIYNYIQLRGRPPIWRGICRCWMCKNRWGQNHILFVCVLFCHSACNNAEML